MTEICGISSGSLTFGCRVKLSHFLVWQAGTNSRYSTGENPPIKPGHQGVIPHLGTVCENHHIYEDLNESSSARPGESQQREIPPSLNSKRAACFSSPADFSSNAGFLPGAGISTPARILSSACFSVNAGISQSACFSVNAGIPQFA